MKDVYLDDERATPSGWHRCHQIYQVIELLKRGEVRRLSLDHDLGSDQMKATGYHLVLWMVEHNCWPKEKPTVHSANPVGAEAMRYLIEKWFGKRWQDEMAKRFKKIKNFGKKLAS